MNGDIDNFIANVMSITGFYFQSTVAKTRPGMDIIEYTTTFATNQPNPVSNSQFYQELKKEVSKYNLTLTGLSLTHNPTMNFGVGLQPSTYTTPTELTLYIQQFVGKSINLSDCLFDTK